MRIVQFCLLLSFLIASYTALPYYNELAKQRKNLFDSVKMSQVEGVDDQERQCEAVSPSNMPTGGDIDPTVHICQEGK